MATTLDAKGLLSEDHRLALGNFGYGGTRRATEALLKHDWDSLLILGAELSERNLGGWPPRLLWEWPPDRLLFQLAECTATESTRAFSRSGGS